MYVLKNNMTDRYARYDSIGEHDGRTTDDVADAREFTTFGQASDYSQNFGPDFSVFALFADQSDNFYSSKAIRRALPPQ